MGNGSNLCLPHYCYSPYFPRCIWLNGHQQQTINVKGRGDESKHKSDNNTVFSREKSIDQHNSFCKLITKATFQCNFEPAISLSPFATSVNGHILKEHGKDNNNNNKIILNMEGTQTISISLSMALLFYSLYLP